MELRIQRSEYMAFSRIIRWKISEIKVKTNSQDNKINIQKDASLQKHPLSTLHQEHVSNILVLKIDLQHLLNFQILEHLVAKRTVQVPMPQWKITKTICQRLMKINTFVVVKMAIYAIYVHIDMVLMNLTSNTAIQRSITIPILERVTSSKKTHLVMLIWREPHTISKWYQLKNRIDLRLQVFLQDKTQMDVEQ